MPLMSALLQEELVVESVSNIQGDKHPFYKPSNFLNASYNRIEVRFQ